MDGLSNISETNPEFTPNVLKPGQVHEHLEISSKKSYEAILDLLKNEPEKTVSIVALGPRECMVACCRRSRRVFGRPPSLGTPRAQGLGSERAYTLLRLPCCTVWLPDESPYRKPR